MKTQLALAVALAVCLTRFTLAADDDHPLAKFGYEATAAGVSDCLRGFVVDETTLATIHGHIARLGNDEFLTREDATNALVKFPVVPQQLLDAAAESDDAEVRIRARRIIEQRGQQPASEMLSAALKVIAEKQIQGLTEDVLSGLATAGTPAMRNIAAQAISVTSTKAALPTLIKALDSKSNVIRYAAVVAIADLNGDKAIGPLRPLLKDDDDHVRLAAATALTNAGERAGLSTFVDLLASEDYVIRLRAAQFLRAVVGKRFDFDPTAQGEAAANGIAAWKKWLATQGALAPLNLPIELAAEFDLLAAGLGGLVGVFDGRVLSVDELSKVCKLEGGVLTFPAEVYGYVRTKTPHENYRFSLEYRWPQDVFNDAGVLVMLHGRDSRDGNAAEVQLHQGNVGDIYDLGDFEIEGRTGVGSKKAAANDKPRGEWNLLEIEVKQRVATIKVNGVMQNEIKGGPDEPTKVGLRIERYPIEFRNLMLLPLD